MRKNRVLKKIAFGLLFITTCLFTLTIGTEHILNNNKIILSADTWKSNLVEVDEYTVDSNINYVDINTLVVLDSDGLVTGVNESIVIDSKTVILINDGLGVYYFSELCNPKFSSTSTTNGVTQNNNNPLYKNFLSYNYELGADIDYEEASKTFKMLRPIGWEEGVPFKGTFNGNGQTITNIFYRPFDDISEVQSLYNGIVYVSWFSQNEGTIKNLGIINPNIIQYDVYDHAVFVSPFVGANAGTIENCYVQDLRGNESGISAEGGYELSMFVSVNTPTGTIKNSYAASNRIAATSVTMSSSTNRSPFVSQNSNITVENNQVVSTGIIDCYYDKQALNRYSTYNTKFENDLEYKISEDNVIKYRDGITALNTADFSNTSIFNHYDIDSGEQVWFSNGTYSNEYTPYLRLTYPVLKGFIVDEEGYFEISTANKLVYMSELIDQYQIFRDAKYSLVKTVDLNTVKPNSFVFTDSVFSGIFKGADKANDGYDIKLVNGKSSDKNSILNLQISIGNSYQGYHCYGLFGVLAGTVENINIVNAKINQNDLTTVNYEETNAVGTVCGLLTGGKIKDVNVYTDISLQQGSSSMFLGTQYVGGICGVAEGGEIIGSTANGTITSPVYTPTSATMNVKYSPSIGGILGKAISNEGVKNCLNNIDITAVQYESNPGSSIRQYLGGVIGSGDINNAYQLQNNGTITVGVQDSSNYYSLVYVSGVIGRVNNATNTNGLYLNNANINYYVTDYNTKAYISGVMNVISDVADKYDTFETTTTYNTIINELAVEKEFEFTSLTNGGILNIVNNLSVSRYPAKYGTFTTISNSIDLRAAGLVYSYLTKMNVVGGYNLDKHYEFNSSGELVEVSNDPQSIDISMIDEYAPAFNADNKVSYLSGTLNTETNILLSKSTYITTSTSMINTTVNLERIYNYSDINYITNNTVNAYMLQLSGCLNGKNFNLRNIRNDGNIIVYFTNETYTNLKMDESSYKNYFGDYKKLKVYGVMEEVSLDHRAQDIYNGGNITVSSSSSIVTNFNYYLSGICYKNVGNDPAGAQDLMIEKGYIGSLHNCINNGDIRITNGDILNGTQTGTASFYGASHIAGITCINSSTISQTFNLGNIYNINNVWAFRDSEANIEKYGGYDYSVHDFEIDSGGICFILQNEVYDSTGQLTSANIIDSANNGTIVAMNTSSNQTFTNAGGFVARNDQGEDGNQVQNSGSTNKNPHLSKIEFSINYGDVYAYNNFETVAWDGEQQSKAAGFVCLGACTIVDTINYGNIYGTQVASGIFGHLFVKRMVEAGLSENSPIYIANSINYGSAKIIDVNSNNQSILCTIGLNSTSADNLDYVSLTTNAYSGSTKINVVAALIGVWAFQYNNDDPLSLKIKYLVNFNDDLNIFGWTNVTYSMTNAEKVAMLENMATTKENDTSPAPFNTDNTNYSYGIKCYTKDTAIGDKTLTDIYSQAYNGGIFNEDYSLRSPGELILDANGEVDATNTDNFIADYIQFVPYSKVNNYLVEKIGLKDTVLSNAYTNALTNVELITSVLKAKNYASLEDIYNTLLQNNRVIVESEEQVVVEEIMNYLDNNQQYLDEVVKILINDSTSLNNILSTTNVETIISRILNELSDDELDYYIIQIITENDGLDDFINDSVNVDFVVNLINSYAKQNNITNEEKQLIINIFDILKNNQSSVEDYITTLSTTEQETLAASIYQYAKDDETITELIADTYFENLIIDNIIDLSVLSNSILNDRLNNGSKLDAYPIEDEEYIQMYNEMYYTNSYSDDDVETAIRNLNISGLISLLNSMQSQANDTSSEMYDYVESGRLNTIGIYLPVSEVNYVAIVNSTNYAYVSSTGKTVNNQIYTGNITNISGDTPSASSYELYVYSNNEDVIYNYNDRYYYWTYDNNNNGFTFTSRREWNGLPNTFFSIAWKNNSNESTHTIWPTTCNETGVFALNATSRTVNGVTDYTFTNILTYDYIDYSSNATAKNNGNLSQEMLNQMEDIITETSDYYDENNETIIEDYLISLYNSSNGNKIPFLKLLFPDSSNSVDVETAINYIINAINVDTNGTYTETYADIILKNISNQKAQGNIVKMMETDGSFYVSILTQMLMVYDGKDDYNITNDIVSELYSVGEDNLNSTTEINDNITKIVYNSSVWDGLTIEQKRTIVKYYIDNEGFDDLVLIDAINENKLSTSEYETIIELLLSENVYNLYSYREELNAYWNDDLFAKISAIIISNSETLFIQYTGLTSSTTIIEDLNKLGIDPSIVTDFTGIYALASSHGILNGLFLPDNIELIEMDYYYTDNSGNLINDPEWRGGTYDNPNYYEQSNTSCVNYKVYYEMKQLKKSIATIIFNMELVDATVDENGEQLEYNNTLYNNTEIDYVINGVDQYGREINEVYFYVPINHNILREGNIIYANMTNGSYELSYGATFDTKTDKLELKLTDVADLTVGTILTDTFVIQAEDTTVKTVYTLNLVITKASYLDPLDEVLVDNINVTGSTTITYTEGTNVTTNNADVTTAMNGYNGSIRVTYTTKNLINRASLLEFVKVYSTTENTISNAINNKTILTLNDNYHFNNIENNGIVVIDGLEEDETGYNSTSNAYNDGKVFFDLSLDNYMHSGHYLIEIALNDTTKYYVLFEKAKSTNASLESLTYNGQTYNDGGNSNQTNMSTHPYGTILTAADLTTIVDNKPKYLDDVVVAPLAKITNVTATVTETDGIKTYEVVYTITAEDENVTNNFTHYIIEQAYNTDIQVVYLNGGIIETAENFPTFTSGYVYEASFAKYDTPSYRFEYSLNEFYTTDNSSYFKVVFYDEAGNEITDATTLELLESYCSINVREGKDFEISFYEEAESMAYYFSLIYENSVEFNDSITNTWEVAFDKIKITKLKNTNSYFDNVTFLSESVVSSIRTMITTSDITLEQYQTMLSDPTREIVALPGKIHYNYYAIDTNKQAAFYMIGLVNKTQLDYYMPTFTLPEGGSVYRIEVINNEVYCYVPYYIDNQQTDDQQELTVFLVNEQGTAFRDLDGNVITVTNNGNTIVYNGITYTLSDVAGKQTIELDGVTIENTSLRTNYNEFGCYDEDAGKFNYVTYRVYSEIYDINNTTYNTNAYYTDYHVAAQDITNNIRFDIVVSYEDKASEIVNSLYSVFVEFTCYALPEGLMSENREDFEYYNKAGLFAYFADGSNILEHGDLQANVAGYYGLYVSVAEGYTYSFILYDSINGKDSNGNIKGVYGDAGEEIYIESSITARTVEIHIIIEKADDTSDDWGVHVKDDSLIK